MGNWFWPDVEDEESAVQVARRAAGLSVFIAVVTGLLVFLHVRGIFTLFPLGIENIVDVLIFLAIGFGIYRMSRAAAVIGLILYIAGQVILGVQTGSYNFIPAIIFGSVFLNSVRGTFAYHSIRAGAVGEGTVEQKGPAAKFTGTVIVALIVALAAFLIYSRLTHRPLTGTSSKIAVWQDFSAPGVLFTVSLPNDPREQSQTGTVPGFGTIKIPYYVSQLGEASFALSDFKLPAAPRDAAHAEHVVDSSVDGVVTNVKGTLVSKKTVRYGSYPGREYQVKATRAFGAQISVCGRIYLVGQDLCHIFVTTPEAEPLANPDNIKFLESFRLGTAPKPLPLKEQSAPVPVEAPVTAAPPAAKQAAAVPQSSDGPGSRTFRLRSGEVVKGKVIYEDEVYYNVETTSGEQKIVIKEDLESRT